MSDALKELNEVYRRFYETTVCKNLITATSTAHYCETGGLQVIDDGRNCNYCGWSLWSSGGVKAPGCEHEWTTYDSGWSRYDYCKRCDEKRNQG